jgi:surface antigen
MIRWIVVTAMLGLSGCQYYYYPGSGVSPYAAPPAAGSSSTAQPATNCREFTQQVIIGGKPTQAVGQVCQQPDGTWKVM